MNSNLLKKLVLTSSVILTNFLFNSCESTADPAPGGDSVQNGQVSFWVGRDFGCGAMLVNVEGKVSNITSYHANGIPNCTQPGTATFTLAPGNYAYTASCNNLQWSGNFNITNNGCLRYELQYSGNTGGSSGNTGGNTGNTGGNSGGTTSTLTFRNPAHTPININFNGETRQIPVSGSATFTGRAGTAATGTASTSGNTTEGKQVGLKISWDLAYNFPTTPGYNADVTLNVSADYFFLKIVNSSNTNITKVYVNYGLQAQTVDNVSINANGQTYWLGYYRAYTNSNVRPESGSGFWSSGNLGLPFTPNQVYTFNAGN